MLEICRDLESTSLQDNAVVETRKGSTRHLGLVVVARNGVRNAIFYFSDPSSKRLESAGLWPIPEEDSSKILLSVSMFANILPCLHCFREVVPGVDRTLSGEMWFYGRPSICDPEMSAGDV